MAVAWNDDPPESASQIRANVRAVGAEIFALAPFRNAPSVEMAQDWHRRIYEGVSLPVRYFAGEIRDTDVRYPELIGYEVSVGRISGVPSSEVPAELNRFEQSARAALGNLDRQIQPQRKPATPAELRSVLLLAAILHGEWVRIHPFANGNGRTGRLWAMWAVTRYGLPPFIRLKPRPGGGGYAAGAFASMSRKHTLMAAVLGEMLDEYLRDLPD